MLNTHTRTYTYSHVHISHITHTRMYTYVTQESALFRVILCHPTGAGFVPFRNVEGEERVCYLNKHTRAYLHILTHITHTTHTQIFTYVTQKSALFRVLICNPNGAGFVLSEMLKEKNGYVRYLNTHMHIYTHVTYIPTLKYETTCHFRELTECREYHEV